MTQQLLTPTMITREAARILHQKGNFLGNVHRGYDDQFAKTGAKIGTSLNLRLPVRYNTRKNAAAFAGQAHHERSTPVSVTSQYGVDVSFSSVEQTMSLDDFSKRVLAPAMNQLAADIEFACLSQAYKWVNNVVNATTNTVLTYRNFQKMNQSLTDALAPRENRSAILSPASTVEFMDATKALFQAQSNLEEQYREGMLLRTGGLDVYENTLLPSHTTGTLAGSPLTNGAALGTSTTSTNTWVSQTVLSIDGATSATTLRAGDVITISGVFAVHPETKQNMGQLQRFVVQNDVTLTTTATAYDVTVRPAMIWGSGNAYQTVTLSGVANTDNLTVTRLGAVNTVFGQDIAFHKDAFVFATADLEDVSQYGAKGARATVDGISLRWAQQYDVSADVVRGRFDILWGFAPLYPEQAVRHMYTQSLIA